ncbi:MAG: hypothetical protein R2760_11845, partial [Chitinophagales bacterium]
MKTFFLENGKTYPLVVAPETDNSLEGLKNWIAKNHEDLEQKLLHYGAILFRGFDIQTPLDFEQVAKSIDADLKNDYM